MRLQEIIETVRGFEGALVVAPEEGSSFPELSWGDAYFYYAPDGRMPERMQPYGTIITKDYPDDTSFALEAAGRFRVNIHVGRERVGELVTEGSGPAQTDAFHRHPLYGSAGWVCVVEPAQQTADLVRALLRDAHEAARLRAERRPV